jgi:hypothetical protein
MDDLLTSGGLCVSPCGTKRAVPVAPTRAVRCRHPNDAVFRIPLVAPGVRFWGQRAFGRKALQVLAASRTDTTSPRAVLSLHLTNPK